jgi:hypothetical protein
MVRSLGRRSGCWTSPKAKGSPSSESHQAKTAHIFARRETIEHRDEIYLGGFGDSCYATRARKSSLIMPGVCQSPHGYPAMR